MADPKATPISALPRGPQGNGEDDQQFIKNILNQMNDDSQESEQAYAQQQQNYNKQQFGHNIAEQHQNNQENIRMQEQAQYEQMGDDQYDYQEEPLSLADKIKQQIKAPLLFLVLFNILCLPFLREFLLTNLMKFTANKTLVNYGSTFILGLIGAVIFYAINRFVL